MDPYVLFIVAYSAIHDEKSIKSLLLALVVVMAVFVGITVLSSFDILSVRRATVDERWGRTRGAFAEANQFAAYLVAFIPLLGAFMMTARSTIVRAMLAGVLLVTLYVLLLSGSRGGLVALFVGTGVYYLLYSRHTLPKSLMNLTMVYVAVLLVMGLVFFTLPDTTASGLLLKLSGKFTDVTETDYSSGRLETWGAGLKLFMHSPLFGTGWRTFIPLVGWNSHNDYILFLVTTGVVGLYLYLLVYVRILKSALECRRLDPVNRHLYNAFISGFISFMVALLFVNIYNPTYFVLLYAALVLKLGALPKPGRELVQERVAEVEPAAGRILRRRQAGGPQENKPARQP
jgi:O-antigen ligase